MPELPEIEVICRELQNRIIDKKITKVTIYRKNLRIDFPENISEILQNKYIYNVHRIAKYILIDIGEKFLVIHLGMSGRLINYHMNRDNKLKHDHLIINLSNNSELVLNDQRRFGLATIINKKEISNHKLFKSLAIDPLSDNFDSIYLKNKLKNRKSSIKTSIMNNQIIVGVGNIYASESLFIAKISPTRESNSLDMDELHRLTTSIKQILKKAIDHGGSTLRDYTNANGETGNFQNIFSVYEKKICNICNNNIIKIKQSGRTSFYCETCQR